jgi:hypothetical protein
MATQTYNIRAAGGLREDLEDVIQDLFPMETYGFTNFEKVKAKATYHEWLTDSLATPATATINQGSLEGADFSETTIAGPTRMGNYTQINTKQFMVSGTLEAVDKAGRRSELARQAMKQMRELKRDIEAQIFGSQGSTAGATASARASGGIDAWIGTTDHGGNGIKATSTAAVSAVGWTAGSSSLTTVSEGATTGALTEALLQDALGNAWEDGGNPSVVVVGRALKAKIDAFTGIATRYRDVASKTQAQIIGAADVYVSDFGTHTVVLSRYCRATTAYCLDPDYWKLAYLRAPSMREIPRTGDAEKRQIIAEWTLVAANPNASAKVAGAT